LILSEDRLLPLEQFERIRADARQLGEQDHFVRALVEGSVTVYAYFAYGKYRECVRIAEDALLALKRAGADFGIGYVYIYLGLAQLALGRAGLARSCYDKAFDLAARKFPHEAQRLEVITCIAEVQYFQNDLDAAQRNVRAIMLELRQQNEVDSTVCLATYPIAAAIHARTGNLDAALSLLAEARSIARYLQRDRRVAALDIQRVEELTRARRCVEAREIVGLEGFQRCLHVRDPSPSIPLLYMQATLAIARLSLACGNPQHACSVLESLYEETQMYEHELIALRCMTLLAAAQFATSQFSRSTEILSSLNSRILPTGLKQILLEEQSLIQPALEYVIASGQRAGTATHANAQLIVETWLGKPLPDLSRKMPTPAHAPAASQFPSILSPRQSELLELLAAGMSGKEIAARLSLSESTVKSYRKVLYEKLGAGRRSQALANARRMMLLRP
jgi:ATP/maltotriose-dependent transcriptional regulator MalT